jgi:hypothetical protein
MAATRTPYAKTIWVDRDDVNKTPGTKLNAQNFNKLEEGLELTDGIVAQLEAAVAALQTANGTVSSMQTELTTLKNNYDKLKADFDAHVHENGAGATTGAVVVPTTPTP